MKKVKFNLEKALANPERLCYKGTSQIVVWMYERDMIICIFDDPISGDSWSGSYSSSHFEEYFALTPIVRQTWQNLIRYNGVVFAAEKFYPTKEKALEARIKNSSETLYVGEPILTYEESIEEE